LRLATASLSEVLQSYLLILNHSVLLTHLRELILSHLHELPLVGDLTLSQFESLVCHSVSRYNLRRVLNVDEHRVLLGLLVSEV